VNESIQKGKVPAAWKFGILVPIPKPGKDTSKLESYRPISLLSCFGKLADRIVTNRLIFHTEAQGILSGSQAGFRQHRGAQRQSNIMAAKEESRRYHRHDSGSN
jgi:hypothetical protein